MCLEGTLFLGIFGAGLVGVCATGYYCMSKFMVKNDKNNSVSEGPPQIE